MMFLGKLILVLVLVTVGEGPELLCFGAKWCKPCQEMAPVIAQLSQDGLPVRKVDVERNGELAARFRVTTVPTFVLIDQNGRAMHTINRAADYNTLRRMLAHYKITPVPPTIRGQNPPAGEGAGIRVADASSFQPEAKPGFSPANQSATNDLPPANEIREPFYSASASPKVPSNRLTNARDMALASSVRLRVEDDNGHSFGTGTVIDVHGNEALILTCGHVFRDSQGKGRILIDRFDMKTSEPAMGTLISHDIDRDVALVSMKLTRPMQIAKLAPLKYQAQENEPVFSIGCNKGASPSILNGQINRIDKYLGPPNITVSGRPVSGRSGGGLFNLDGELIGVCSAADPEIDEGIYGALPRVYYELDRNGLSFVYRPQEEPTNETTTETKNPESPIDNALNPLQPLQSGSNVVRPNNGFLPTANRELVCVLHGSDGKNKAYVIKNPSPTLLQYLEKEASNTSR